MINQNRKRFKSALKTRGAQISAIREFGWTWSSVTSHFERDCLLGGVTSKSFASAWSRLISEGWLPDENLVAAYKEEILAAGGLRPGMWVIEERTSHSDPSGAPSGEEADVVRRMRLASKLAKTGHGNGAD